MAKHIPFVYGKLDSQLANKIFGDSEVIRMPLQAGETVRRSLPKRSKVWVDAGVDRYHWPDVAAARERGWREATNSGNRPFKKNQRPKSSTGSSLACLISVAN